MNETFRELDHRTADMIDVWLLWRETDNAVLVSVADDKTGDRFTIEWPPRSGRTQEFPEVDRAEWFALDAAREKINPAQAELIDRLS